MKRSAKMLLILITCAVIFGGYYLIQTANQKNAESTVVRTVSVTAQEEMELSGMAWALNGEPFDFSCRDGQWFKTDNASFPVDQEALASLAERVLSLSYTKEIENTDALADFGLEKPAFSLTVRWKDGKETVYDMGSPTPFSDGYYMRVSGRENGVYTIENDLTVDFNKNLTAWTVWEETPRISAVNRMRLGSLWEIVKDEQGLWRNAATQEILEASVVEKMTSAAKRFVWNELVDAEASEEELQAFGLDDVHAVPLTLSNDEQDSFTLLLGAISNGLCYARLPGSAMVYTVANLGQVVAADMETLYRKKPVTAAAENIASAVFSADGASWSLDRKENAASDGAQTASYTVNEAPADAEAAKGILTMLTSLAAVDRVETEERKEPSLTIHITDRDGAAAEITLLSYDDETYLMPVNEKIGLLFDAKDVDALKDALKQLH